VPICQQAAALVYRIQGIGGFRPALMPPKLAEVSSDLGNDMRIGQLALVAFSASWLGACGFLPPSQNQEFAVSGAPPTQTVGVFRNADANIDDGLARQICIDGYEKLSAQTLPADPGTFEVWHLRCAPHQAWFWPLS